MRLAADLSPSARKFAVKDTLEKIHNTLYENHQAGLIELEWS
jgi:hypothetical protein